MGCGEEEGLTTDCTDYTDFWGSWMARAAKSAESVQRLLWIGEAA
jgi:hypothetical protein